MQDVIGTMVRVQVVRALLALLPVAIALSACRPATPDGSLELRWLLAPGSSSGVTEVVVTPSWAGANRGPVRDEAWTHVAVVDGDVTVRALAPSAGTVAEGPIPAGSYDRVFIAATEARGRLPGGEWISLENHIEPIARGFDLAPGGHVAIDIELIVLPSSSVGDGRPQIFVKDAVPVGHATPAGTAHGVGRGEELPL